MTYALPKLLTSFGMSGVTCSGQIFAAPDPLVRPKVMKGKEKVGMEEGDKASPILNEEIPTRRFAKVKVI